MLKADLHCELLREPHALRLGCTLFNHGATPLGVFDRQMITHLDGTPSFSPNLVYVDLHGTTAVVQALALPIPEGLGMAAYTAPFASRIGPTERRHEWLSLPLPLRVCNPFTAALVDGSVIADVEKQATAIEVRFGVFACTSDFELAEAYPAVPGVYQAEPISPALQGQHTLSQRIPLDAPITVLDYRGAAWPE